jgi:hypothetical protein
MQTLQDQIRWNRPANGFGHAAKAEMRCCTFVTSSIVCRFIECKPLAAAGAERITNSRCFSTEALVDFNQYSR